MPWRADGPPPRPVERPVDCARARDWIDPYLDELEEQEAGAEPEAGLDPARRDALEAHLADCADCRAEIALARRLREGLRAGLPLLACPPAVSDEVLRIAAAEAAAGEAAAREGRAGRPGLGTRLRGWLTGGGALRPAFAAAALLALLLAAPVLYRSVLDPVPAEPRTASGDGAPAATEELEYTAAEIAEAEEQARMILAYVASVGRDAGRTVQEDVFDRGIVRPTRRAVEGLQSAGVAGEGEPAGRNRE